MTIDKGRWKPSPLLESGACACIPELTEALGGIAKLNLLRFESTKRCLNQRIQGMLFMGEAEKDVCIDCTPGYKPHQS